MIFRKNITLFTFLSDHLKFLKINTKSIISEIVNSIIFIYNFLIEKGTFLINHEIKLLIQYNTIAIIINQPIHTAIRQYNSSKRKSNNDTITI